MNGQDADLDDEGDESMDDDMDKISSSPPIDDGGYSRPWPSRKASLLFAQTPKEKERSSIDSDLLSSSPFVTTPTRLPLSLSQLQNDQELLSEVHHQEAGYSAEDVGPRGTEQSYDSEQEDQLTPLMSERRLSYFRGGVEEDVYDADIEAEHLSSLLLPVNDPLLDNSFDDEFGEGMLLDTPDTSDNHELTNDPYLDDDDSDTDHDDNDDDISFADSRFIDSGWGGQCLRETEDIDFEFVYALHTFVATVEGQANATKGDTMVLLDDSNSYWWLVRVVKDTSIGTFRVTRRRITLKAIQGYLPAEHIETPTERLARLNKHRNIDVNECLYCRKS